MLVFGLLAKGVEKLDTAKEKLLEQHFAQKGCSKSDMANRLEVMRLRGEEIRRMTNERDKRAQEAWKAKEGQRLAEEASRSGTGTNRHLWCPAHRKT